MKDLYRILAINPGSTSTKIALFENDREVYKETIDHPPEELRSFREIQDQLLYRRETVEKSLAARGLALNSIDVFVGRGGGLVPCLGGTYVINDTLVDHASRGMSGQHPAQLASQICKLLIDSYGGQGFVVNPPDTDEFEEIARISGVKGLYRESRIHALNQKEAALRYCAGAGRDYYQSRFIICHIGGGISVTAHKNGRMVDSNDIMNGDGPMMPTRSGTLPYLKVLRMAFSGEWNEKELTARLNRDGGLLDHLGTADAREVEKRIRNGDSYAKIVYDAMIYQIGKNVGSCAAVLEGKADAIILTGGISSSEYVTETLKKYIDWIAPVHALPGEFEMEALAAGALRVVRGEERARVYDGVPVWQGFDL
ncbi:MAG: butyrate kinase [Treponema sp.]|jgi:butyrate kinase|nr:butyrate kinase [Treponema sp.]